MDNVSSSLYCDISRSTAQSKDLKDIYKQLQVPEWTVASKVVLMVEISGYSGSVSKGCHMLPQ